MIRSPRITAIAPLCCAALLSLGNATHAAPPPDQDALAGGQVKVDVGDRKINRYCVGKGSPTVLFESDLGRAGWDWSAVLPEVAKRTRACVYDRAGFGFSDPATRASTLANASRDLNFLLKNSHMDGQFVLVGAGYGAMIVQHFAARARGAVSVTGLVLVEPLHEDALPKDAAASLEAALACLAAAEQGKAGAGCTYPASTINGDIGDIGARLAAAQAALAAKPTYWRARASELDSLATSAGQLRTARKPLGDMPVAELAHGDPAAIVAAIFKVLDQQK